MNIKRFKIALAALDLTAIEVARKIGVHHSTLSTWVNGYYSVPIKYRETISNVLEIEESVLFDASFQDRKGARNV